ncbi:MAG: hypothetical protein GDA39_01135 [Hyphomonadaceae bacterium]|nr:hypothetical protein [Hyphomonadaceae bacterium]MBC6411605.1 hypothetical protein [Hyphomonadaceae bacterium]
MKKTFRHTVLGGLMLAATVGLVPAAFSQGAVPAAPVPQGNTFLETVDYIGSCQGCPRYVVAGLDLRPGGV